MTRPLHAAEAGTVAGELDSPEAVAAYTRRLVAGAFEQENLRRQADRDPTRLTMSGLGGCTRQAAYAIAGTPPSDVPPPEEARQAMLGSWIHDHLLPGMAAGSGPGAVVEDPVQLKAAGLVINGTLDLAHGPVVWDLKSVREWRLDGVRRRGTYSEHRVQVMGYALARFQAGHDVRWVCWLYIDRSSGDIHVEVEPFTNAAALAVIARVDRIRWHAEDDPDRAPREARGPGMSFACDRCPWLTRCWGPEAKPGVKGAQRSAAATQEGIEQALALYAAGAAMASAGKADQEFAKLVLADVKPGTYGGWKLSYGRPGEQLDQAKVAEDYAAAGKPVPKSKTAGRIMVKPAPQDQGT